MRARASRELGVALAGFAAVLFLQFFRLGQVPGLHFDEAWAYRHAARLATGAFTLEAMSPYTMPWAHYWGALWLQVFGTELWVFRASQAFLSVAGLGFCAVGLASRLGGRAGALFPWAVLFLPGLLFNHRFFVELNGWHVLCFGLGFWALARGRAWLVAFAWVAGTTSHLLFYPWGAALLGAAWLSGRSLSAKERWAAGVAALVLSVFFLRVYAGVPEKGKALALLLSGVGLGFHALYLSRFPRRWPERWLLVGLGFVALPFLVNLLFFAEGSWNYAIQTGAPLWRHTFYLLFLAVPLLAWLAWRGWGELAVAAAARFAFLLGVIGLGLLMLKPAPRYFETALLVLAMLMALGLGKMRARMRLLVMGALALHALLLYPSYFVEAPVETELRLGPFKDSSRDFLSKQTLARVLGARACALSDINSVDSRVGEALAALALSPADWPVAEGRCPWPGLVVERRAESSPGFAEEVADFRLRGKGE